MNQVVFICFPFLVFLTYEIVFIYCERYSILKNSSWPKIVNKYIHHLMLLFFLQKEHLIPMQCFSEKLIVSYILITYWQQSWNIFVIFNYNFRILKTGTFLTCVHTALPCGNPDFTPHFSINLYISLTNEITENVACYNQDLILNHSSHLKDHLEESSSYF